MVALAVAGTTLDHIQKMLQDAESGSTRQDEVTPCKYEWNIWCFGNSAKIEKRFRMFFDLCTDFRIFALSAKMKKHFKMFFHLCTLAIMKIQLFHKNSSYFTQI